MEEVVQLVSNVGFPIAMCILMYFQNREMQKTVDANTTAILELKSGLEKLNKE